MERGRLRIFFDGGCRPNPGPMEVAAVARGIAYKKCDIGDGSNDDAEWLALLHAVEVAIALGGTDVEFVGDSTLVVNQASGVSKCRSSTLARHLERYKTAVAGIARVRVRHIARSKNLAGIALAQDHDR